MPKKITYEEIIKGHHFSSYTKEAAYILSKIENKEIIPIKKSPTNGKKPALPLRYWKNEDETDFTDLENELRFSISTRINIDYYLKHLDVYLLERGFVLALSDYLENSADELSIMMSVNERSFAIWQREKFLSGIKENGISAARVLTHCNMSVSDLNVYQTAEPLAYLSISKEEPQNILISENLDPFYGMRKFLMENENISEVLGKKIGTIVYGGGKRVSRAFKDFEFFTEPYMRNKQNTFLYAGDLDYEGISIFENFAKAFKGRLNIVPFTALYEKMLQKALQLNNLPYMKEGQVKVDGTDFFAYFNKDYVEAVQSLLKSNHYIPQEILSVQDYTL